MLDIDAWGPNRSGPPQLSAISGRAEWVKRALSISISSTGLVEVFGWDSAARRPLH